MVEKGKIVSERSCVYLCICSQEIRDIKCVINNFLSAIFYLQIKSIAIRHFKQKLTLNFTGIFKFISFST